MKKKIKITLLFFAIINIALAQKSIISKYIKEDKKNIIGTWVSEEDKNWKRVFTASGKCYDYYDNKLTGASTYKISNTSPQCGDSVLVDKRDKVDYLELTDIKDGFKLCYEINGVTSVLSLTYLERGKVIVMDRIYLKKHNRKGKS